MNGVIVMAVRCAGYEYSVQTGMGNPKASPWLTPDGADDKRVWFRRVDRDFLQKTSTQFSFLSPTNSGIGSITDRSHGGSPEL